MSYPIARLVPCPTAGPVRDRHRGRAPGSVRPTRGWGRWRPRWPPRAGGCWCPS